MAVMLSRFERASDWRGLTRPAEKRCRAAGRLQLCTWFEKIV